MTITDDLIDNLGELSRLRFVGDERERMKGDLTRMLDFIAQIQSVDTTGVEPLIHLTHEVNRWRDDVPETEITHAEALANAPKKDSDYFRVPKFIEKE